MYNFFAALVILPSCRTVSIYWACLRFIFYSPVSFLERYIPIISFLGENSNAYGYLVKQVRTPPVRPADGVVGCVYESFVPGKIVVSWDCGRR